MYKYEIWHEGNCIMDRTGIDDDEYESEEEALEAATEEAEDRIQEWKEDGCWDGETLEDMDIRVREI